MLVSHAGQVWRAQSATSAEPGVGDAARAVGFGREATGGSQPFVVTSLSDAGAGSLRSALDGGGRHITFAVDGVIALRSDLRVPSNTTIDGRGRNVTVTSYGLSVRDVNNVVIRDLRFRDGRQDSYQDAISIWDARNIWVDHVEIRNYFDGAIDIIRGSGAITVSNSRFTDHGKVMLLDPGVDQLDRSFTVTIHDNVFTRTGQRNPLVRSGLVHLFNNYFEDWDYYAVRSERHAQLLSEQNMFVPGDRLSALRSDVDPRFGSVDGAIRSVGDRFVGDVYNIILNSSSVFDASSYYSYTLSGVGDEAIAALHRTAGAGTSGTVDWVLVG